MDPTNESDFNASINGSGYSDDVGYYPKMWTVWLMFISTPIIVLIGIVGNSFSLMVMKSKALKNKSYSHYLCALAVFDTITLILRLVNIIDQYKQDELQDLGIFHAFTDVTCKLYNFLEHTSYMMSSWLVVLMAVERFVAVSLPFKKVFIRKQSGAIFAICMLLFLVCSSQVFRLVMMTFDEIDGRCVASFEYVAVYTSLNVYFYQLTLTLGVPVTLVLLCNILIIRQIFKIRRATRCKDSPNTRYSRVVHRRHRTTCMLLIVAFTFIATQLPLLIVTIVTDVGVKVMDKMAAWNLYLSILPFTHACIAISLINYAVNFFIYIVSGRSFRFELRKIFIKERNSSMTGTRTREEFIRL